MTKYTTTTNDVNTSWTWLCTEGTSFYRNVPNRNLDRDKISLQGT